MCITKSTIRILLAHLVVLSYKAPTYALGYKFNVTHAPREFHTGLNVRVLLSCLAISVHSAHTISRLV